MAATLSTLRLYEGMRKIAQQDLHLDHRDPDMLRSTMVSMVDKVTRGRRVDLSRYRLVVMKPNGNGYRAELRVTPAGANEVKRLAGW